MCVLFVNYPHKPGRKRIKTSGISVDYDVTCLIRKLLTGQRTCPQMEWRPDKGNIWRLIDETLPGIVLFKKKKSLNQRDREKKKKDRRKWTASKHDSPPHLLFQKFSKVILYKCQPPPMKTLCVHTITLSCQEEGESHATRINKSPVTSHHYKPQR